jgi:carbon starvation protein
MSRIVFNDYVDATLAAVFAAIVVAMVIYGVIESRKALANPKSTAVEIGMAGAVAGGGDD